MFLGAVECAGWGDAVSACGPEGEVPACGMAEDGRAGVVVAWVGCESLEDGVCCMGDVLEGSGIAAAGVSETPVFEAARDRSLAGEGGAESANVL